MKVLVAGASGTMGRPLIRLLIQRGHEVVGLTRSDGRKAIVEREGARAVVADVLDAERLTSVVRSAAPTHVVHLLTALPAGGPMRSSDLRATNQLRREGTRNLLAAAIAAGTGRLIAESFLSVYGAAWFDIPRREEEPLVDAGRGPLRDAVLALRDLEDQLRRASEDGAIETAALRFGMTYGPGVPSTDAMARQARSGRLFAPRTTGVLPFVHIDDVASATFAALDRGTRSGAYNVVDDEAMSLAQFLTATAEAFGGRRPRGVPSWLVRLIAPVIGELASYSIPLSNSRARTELGWSPAHSNARDGLRDTARRMQQAA
jgi:nucleoside-diphosphate-sugar epimerase